MKNILLLLLALPFLAFGQTEKGVSPISTSPTSSSGQTYAVVIGISDYQEKDIPDLRFADKDALAFANFLRSPAGGSLDGDLLQVLTNKNATAGRVAEALDALVEQTKEGDQVIIYFSGHGDVERKYNSQPGFLLCWDAPSRVYMGGGTFSLAYLQETVTTLSLNNKAKVTVITDACHAGKLAGSQIGGTQLTSANLAKQYANEVKILSCQPNEFSLEGEQWGGGRGIFSYHLVDGLFGLADRNGDGSVTVGEIDRYLEDHVTAEAAPQSQVPMLLGNKTERLATVNAAILAALQKAKAGGMPVFAATEGRGFEEEILAKADSSIRQMYLAFKKAVREKRFFRETENVGRVSNPSDVGPPADELFAQLAENETLAPLRGMMKRNYAAALQDEAQQAINTWLAANPIDVNKINRKKVLQPIPQQLGRAAELLGESHYMYRSLQARKKLFEGIVNWWAHTDTNKQRFARSVLPLFEQSKVLEPESPLPWYYMSRAYAAFLNNPDSAFFCAHKANELAPKWVMPLAYLSPFLPIELADKALTEAEAIDSLHQDVILFRADWYLRQKGESNTNKAVSIYQKYRDSGRPVSIDWHLHFASVLQRADKYTESEAEIRKAISMDSTYVLSWFALKDLYKLTGRMEEVIPVCKKVISLDSTEAMYWELLGEEYANMRRFAEAEPVYKKVISLDSTIIFSWVNLGFIYLNTRRFAEAEPVLKKGISLDSTNVGPYNNLGYLYLNTSRYAEAEQFLKKGIALDSAFANPRKHLGMAYFKTNRPDEARQNFLKAIALNPNYAPAMLGMAYLLASEGKTEEALGYVEQAVGKRVSFEQLEKDEDLAPLRALPEWKGLMKKYFSDKVKD